MKAKNKFIIKMGSQISAKVAKVAKNLPKIWQIYIFGSFKKKNTFKTYDSQK